MNTQEQDFSHITFHSNCKKGTKVVTNKLHTSCQSEDSLLKKNQKKSKVWNITCIGILSIYLCKILCKISSSTSAFCSSSPKFWGHRDLELKELVCIKTASRAALTCKETGSLPTFDITKNTIPSLLIDYRRFTWGKRIWWCKILIV